MSLSLEADSHALILHRKIRSAVKTHRQAEHALALLLHEMAQICGFKALGFATLAEYAQVSLQLNSRKARDLARLGGRLPNLPVLNEAMAEDSFPWTKARELIRVVTPDTEQAWLDRARSVSSRELEAHVGHAKKGDLPPSIEALSQKPVRTRMVFEMDAAEAEVLRDAIAFIKTQLGGDGPGVEDGAVLVEMARRVLHDASNEDAPTATRFRTVLQRCPDCDVVAAHDAEVSDVMADLSCCDAEVVDLRPGPKQGHVSRTIPPAVRRTVLHRDKEQCRVPGCNNRLWTDLHHISARSDGGENTASNLVSLCSTHHELLHKHRLTISGNANALLRFERRGGRLAWG